ncbi:helix-turn-helix domain-containing protein [Streptomyces acidiscabies]|uniref:Helix-turn-helix transcriptional regulator n=1 Tax=Streptomyces acidiscabies TaxID=42234 RepID=A0ABU4MA91_9ACTN|nr:helix-turn-helix transcriptional regulator [Streptomyces acidiscabies]MDX3024082.1 helix-turn-helix transcriptional regulator [Streptomyces acidiscabies]
MPEYTAPADLPGTQIRKLRLTLDLTQEELATRSGLSVGVVKKIEQGGNGRLDTYHALARALKVRTSALFEPGAPHATTRDDADKVDLMPLRQAIAPPMGPTGRLLLDNSVDPEPDLAHLRTTAAALAASYYSDDYGRTATFLPALVISARLAADHFDNGPHHTEALQLRADVLQMTGRYLTQVRAYDLAHTALRDSLLDAVAADDQARASSAVYLQGWLLMRQGRLDEAERLALATADEVEPRISRATKGQLGAWGRLLIRGSSAAARNNRPQEARGMLRLARTAGSALGGGVAANPYGWGKFDWSTVAFQAVENQVVAGQPRRVLGLSARIPALVSATANTWNRHQLDVAQAHVQVRQVDESTQILAALLDEAPEWLRHQQMAADTFEESLRASKKRRLTAQQRRLATFFKVA